jgi:hypothetical protein
MNSKTLMEEYDVEIDDVRWYLSVGKAEELLSHYQEPKGLIRMIWDKSLEETLYNMEERFIERLDADLADGTADEVKIRQIFSEIKAARRRRRAVRKS